MDSRSTRNKRKFQIEFLEGRKAPSHVGALAHVAAVHHHGHTVTTHKGGEKEDAGTDKGKDK